MSQGRESTLFEPQIRLLETLSRIAILKEETTFLELLKLGFITVKTD